jgi:hypothetical protein
MGIVFEHVVFRFTIRSLIISEEYQFTVKIVIPCFILYINRLNLNFKKMVDFYERKKRRWGHCYCSGFTEVKSFTCIYEGSFLALRQWNAGEKVS